MNGRIVISSRSWKFFHSTFKSVPEFPFIDTRVEIQATRTTNRQRCIMLPTCTRSGSPLWMGYICHPILIDTDPSRSAQGACMHHSWPRTVQSANRITASIRCYSEGVNFSICRVTKTSFRPNKCFIYKLLVQKNLFPPKKCFFQPKNVVQSSISRAQLLLKILPPRLTAVLEPINQPTHRPGDPGDPGR